MTTLEEQVEQFEGVPEEMLASTALHLPSAIDFETWSRLGERLFSIGRGYQWWLGDWLRTGDELFGQEMVQAIDLTGIAPSTLSTWQWCATRIPEAQRRETLPWTHHREVAELDSVAKRMEILDKAEEEGLSSRDVAQMVRAAKALDVGESEPVEGKDPKTTKTFTLSFTVYVADTKSGLLAIEQLENVIRADLFERGVEITKLSRTAS